MSEYEVFCREDGQAETEKQEGHKEFGMNSTLIVKNHIIGEGKPLVCVPIMETTGEAVLAKAREMVRAHVDMIEWRVDAFAQADDLNAIRGVLGTLAPVVKDTVLVYTFRSKNQGGLRSLSQEQICDIHEVAAESRVVDFVDVEFFEAKNAAREIKMLQEKGVYVIASHHDFEQTPGAAVMEILLDRMRGSGAAVVKLAVMPQDAEDVLLLLQETGRFHRNFPETPIITMSMGPLGCISRVAGETFGSCVTFGAFDRASAPGQLPVKELDEVLSILHTSMAQNK
jgi:3-dehydroquinate dehydratase-1